MIRTRKQPLPLCYRNADTYGHQMEKVLVDSTVNECETIGISDRTCDDFQVYPEPKSLIDRLEIDRELYEPLTERPAVPGFDEFVPRLRGRLGQRVSLNAKDACNDQQRERMKQRQAMNYVYKRVSLPEANAFTDTERRIPFEDSEFELNGANESAITTFNDHTSGCRQRPPFGYGKFSHDTSFTNSMLCDFVANYRLRRSTEWTPINVYRPDPPLIIQPGNIYHKHIGMLPNYGGHIPGAMFRCGKTFGNDSRDAKRALRGDRW